MQAACIERVPTPSSSCNTTCSNRHGCSEPSVARRPTLFSSNATVYRLPLCRYPSATGHHLGNPTERVGMVVQCKTLRTSSCVQLAKMSPEERQVFLANLHGHQCGENCSHEHPQHHHQHGPGCCHGHQHDGQGMHTPSSMTAAQQAAFVQATAKLGDMPASGE